MRRVVLTAVLLGFGCSADARESLDRFDLPMSRVSMNTGDGIVSATYCTDAPEVPITNDNQVRSRFNKICIQLQERFGPYASGGPGPNTMSWQMPVQQTFSIRKAGRDRNGFALNDITLAIQFQSLADLRFPAQRIDLGQISRSCNSDNYNLQGQFPLAGPPILTNVTAKATLHLDVIDRDRC